MSDLVAELKARLTVQDIIGQTYTLKRRGRMLDAYDSQPEKPGAPLKKSLTIDPAKQIWVWFAATPDAGQKNLGGDVLAWIAYTRYGRVRVQCEEFIEVLKIACKMAGIDYEQAAGRPIDPERAKAKALIAQKREIMAAYHEASLAARTKEFYVRARQIGASPDGAKKGKTFLTAECIDEWQIGCAPTLAQCRATGLTEQQLRLCKLLVDYDDGGPDPSSRMSFYDALIIPWFESGEIVFLSSRRLVDYARNGEKLPADKKSKSMYGVDKGGVARPAAFNLDTLRSLFNPEKKRSEHVKELLIVEGPLDAIACEQQGHAAIALGNTSPTDELVAHLKTYPQVLRFVALDGTDDVDALKRAEVASQLGVYTRVCQLPADQDPDDQDAAALAALKAMAVDVFESWGSLVN